MPQATIGMMTSDCIILDLVSMTCGRNRGQTFSFVEMTLDASRVAIRQVSASVFPYVSPIAIPAKKPSPLSRHAIRYRIFRVLTVLFLSSYRAHAPFLLQWRLLRSVSSASFLFSIFVCLS